MFLSRLARRFASHSPARRGFRPQLERMEDRVVPATKVYVDDSFARLPSGTPVADANQLVAGNQPATVGVNAFGTIQEGVNAVAPYGQIFVNPGTYRESVLIDKALHLQGDQGVPSISRGAGPNAPVLDGTGLNVTAAIRLAAGVRSVNIAGFRIANYTAAAGSFGINASAAGAGTRGIGVYDNTFRNLNRAAIRTDGPQHGVYFVTRNRFENVGVGAAVDLRRVTGRSAIVTQNVFVRTAGRQTYGVAVTARAGDDPFVVVNHNRFRGRFGYAVLLYADGGTIRNATASGNTLTSTGRGFRYVQDRGGAITGAQLFGNRLQTTSFAVYNQAPAVVSAPTNFWGTQVATRVAGRVIGRVDFSPYTPTDKPFIPGQRGFLFVTSLGAVATAFGRIEEGLVVGYGRTVVVQPGTYTESRTVRSSSPLRLPGVATMQPVNRTIGLSGRFSLTADRRLQVGGSTPGELRLRGNFALDPTATLTLRLNGPTPAQFDRLVVAGETVRLNGARLDLRVRFRPAVGTRFLLVRNDGTRPTVGTFAGLPNDATFRAGGRTFRIVYNGFGTNDVYLQVIA